jgi:hypothetical protein
LSTPHRLLRFGYEFGMNSFLVMAIDQSQEPPDPNVVQNSSLYKEFQAEREEILRHKWIESEKAGYDIGFERALTDWIVNHRSDWRRSRKLLSH